MKNEKGEDLVSIGFVVELDYADATTSPHDLLQLVQAAPAGQEDPRGRRARRLGRQGAARAAATGRCPSCRCRARVLVGDCGGMVDTMALKGVHHCIKSGILAAEAIYKTLKGGGTDFSAYEEAVEESSIGKELYEVRNARQPLQKGLSVGGAAVRHRRRSPRASCPPGRLAWHRNDDQADVRRQDRRQVPQAGRQVHVRQALLGLHHGQRDPRRRAQPHPHPEARAARGRRDLEVDVPGRRLRDPRRRAGDRATST